MSPESTLKSKHSGTSPVYQPFNMLNNSVCRLLGPDHQLSEFLWAKDAEYNRAGGLVRFKRIGEG
jgi:hypothetical protein